MALKVKHRCGCCRKVLREDGTCQNPQCPRYVPEVTEEQPKQEEPADKK
jgi:hypothetical protein